ncbi:hypothetical protein [Geomicrobium sp. JCM 19037]|nr:hypothetical protein [Geomicrobium sp. JCM 19037]
MKRLPDKERNQQEQEEKIKKLERLIDKMEEMTTSARLKDIAYHLMTKKK